MKNYQRKGNNPDGKAYKNPNTQKSPSDVADGRSVTQELNKLIVDHYVISTFLGIGIALIIGWITQIQWIKPDRLGYIGVALVVNVALYVFFSVSNGWDVKRSSPPPPPPPQTSQDERFSVKILGQNGPNMKKDWADFRFVYPMRGQELMCPISAALLVEVTSTSDKPFVITSFSAEVENRNGDWEKATALPVELGQLYFQNTAGMGWAMNPLGASLGRLIKNRTILPKQVMTGYLYLYFDGPSPAMGLRLQADYRDDNDATVIGLPTDDQTPIPVVQSGTFGISDGSNRDINGLPVVPLQPDQIPINEPPLFTCRIYQSGKDQIIEIRSEFASYLPTAIGVELSDKQSGNLIRASYGQTENAGGPSQWASETAGTARGISGWLFISPSPIGAGNSFYLRCKTVPLRVFVGTPARYFTLYPGGNPGQ